jgi:hypothetical protein
MSLPHFCEARHIFLTEKRLVQCSSSWELILRHRSEQCFFWASCALLVDPRDPRTATIVNTGAYRSIGLDFHLWSIMPPDLQRAYWGHFSMVLATSKFRRFNIKHRFEKKLHNIGVFGQVLFIYQTDLYGDEMVAAMVEAIAVLAKCNWSPESIKPIVSYLAAKLHQPSENFWLIVLDIK